MSDLRRSDEESFSNNLRIETENSRWNNSTRNPKAIETKTKQVLFIISLLELRTDYLWIITSGRDKLVVCGEDEVNIENGRFILVDLRMNRMALFSCWENDIGLNEVGTVLNELGDICTT